MPPWAATAGGPFSGFHAGCGRFRLGLVMGLVCRIILVLAIFGISSARMLGAAAADALAFKAAAEAFQGGFYDRAQAEFAEFAQKYPASSLLGEAWLFQAQALILSSNY